MTEAAERWFTDEELQDLSIRTIDRAKAAIDAGDAEQAKQLVDLMYDQFTHLHDGYMTWIGGLQTYLYEHYGIEVLEEAERSAHEIESRLVFKPSGETDPKKWLEGFIRDIHGHVHQPMHIEEDDEKITITVDPCGSGGRLIEMGGYDPEIGLALIKEPCNITWQMEDFPIYCIHCPVMRAQDFERSGNFKVVKGFKDDKIQGACCAYYYKNRADIPESFYTRIGKQKPE